MKIHHYYDILIVILTILITYLNIAVAFVYFGPSNFTSLNKIIKKPSLSVYYLTSYGIPYAGLVKH